MMDDLQKRIERLKKHGRETMIVTIAEIESLQRQLEVARQTLELFADDANWEPCVRDETDGWTMPWKHELDPRILADKALAILKGSTQ